MQEKGINSTFKKIISESSEMVFLADGTFPNSIFFSNQAFQSQIGDSLNEKTLAGLGFDTSAYLYKEDLILSHDGKDYSFKIESPDENGSNYFLFHKGKEIINAHFPTTKESQQFLSSSKDIFVIGRRDKLTFINDAVTSILGYEAGDLLNKSICNLIPEADLENIKSIWENNIGKSQNVFFETSIISKDGIPKEIECSVQFVNDRFFIIGHEILEKSRSKILEKLLIESAEPCMIVYADGKIFLANSEVLNLFGLDKEKEFKHLSELGVLFDDSDIWKDWIYYGEKDANIQRFSSLLLNAQGNQLTLEIASKFISIEDQGLISLTFRNISEKVNLQKNLEESTEFLKNLTDQVPGGLYQMVLGGDGKIKFSFLSQGIENVLGINPEEINDFEDISDAISRIHSSDIPKVIMSAVTSARTQEPWQCQFRVKADADENKYRWILGAARPQVLTSGEMVWYGYLTDISNQKEFEAKLDEARKTAEKANQIKSDFLSMISHELRTPLNAISGSTYSLLQEQPSEAQKNELNTINFAVDNLIIMINDLLDFQKIEAGKLKIEKNPFNIQILVNQIIKGLSFHARDSENNLELKISKGLDIWLKGDKTRLSQILNNLITNALKFTKAGDVDLTVLLKDFKDNKVKVYFEIKDTGIGIDKANQEMIFNDFDQVKPSFSTKYGGTGLGLSITRKLLNLMGGTIQLESEVGKGSRFYFDLEFDLAEEQLSLNSPKKEDFLGSSTLNLLMAEDNDVNALVLGKIIKKWGFSFERVYNGQEAVKAVEKKKYDCVLMDIQMPVMDGFDATVAIKSFSDIPIIALTAASKLEIMDKIDECGFDGFVAKPIDATELLKKINEMVLGESYSA
ncbi:ATP-binding protein [Algoriphagus sp. SE2]|uniref:ATP-binding protein n=1 Tax=Algoriphagus sp. SE2 TaxID=3141536 RepID=UPI0031CD3421